MVVNPFTLTLLHSEWLKLLRVLAVLSAIGLKCGGEPIYLNPSFGQVHLFYQGMCYKTSCERANWRS